MILATLKRGAVDRFPPWFSATPTTNGSEGQSLNLQLASKQRFSSTINKLVRIVGARAKLWLILQSKLGRFGSPGLSADLGVNVGRFQAAVVLICVRGIFRGSLATAVAPWDPSGRGNKALRAIHASARVSAGCPRPQNGVAGARGEGFPEKKSPPRAANTGSFIY